MISDLLKAFGQLGDPATRRVLWQALGLAAACLLVLWLAAWLGLDWLGGWALEAARAEGWSDFWTGVVELLFSLTAVSAALVASFLLFPALAALALSFLLDSICAAVERRHYPDLAPAREQPWLEMLGDGLRLALVTVALNLLVLPIYLLLLFVPPLNLLVFYGLNGYLLGREYFELVAVRRLESSAVRRLRKRHAARVFLAGVVIAILLTIPLINLVMPVVAAALMVHAFERIRRRRATAEEARVRA